MKFLCDENIGLEVTTFLRKLGHDVKSIAEFSPGTVDEAILALAKTEKRILITSDTDFGELVYLHGLTHSGLVLLRLTNEINPNKIRILKQLLNQYSRFLANNFIVVTESKIRIR